MYYKISSFIYTFMAVSCIITGVICCSGHGRLLEQEDLQGLVFILGSLSMLSLSLISKLYGEKEKGEGDDDGKDQSKD